MYARRRLLEISLIFFILIFPCYCPDAVQVEVRRGFNKLISDVFKGLNKCGDRAIRYFYGGLCECKKTHGVFYGNGKNAFCESRTTIQSLNGCNSFHDINKFSQNNISLPCFPRGKDAFVVYVRNLKNNSNVQFWDGSFSKSIIKHNIVLERDKLKFVNLPTSLILKVTFPCPAGKTFVKRCIIIKNVGTNFYPYTWKAPTAQTTHNRTTKPPHFKRSKDNQNDSLPLIIGLVAAAIIIVLLIIFLVIYCRKRRNRISKQVQQNKPSVTSPYEIPHQTNLPIYESVKDKSPQNLAIYEVTDEVSNEETQYENYNQIVSNKYSSIHKEGSDYPNNKYTSLKK